MIILVYKLQIYSYSTVQYLTATDTNSTYTIMLYYPSPGG